MTSARIFFVFVLLVCPALVQLQLRPFPGIRGGATTAKTNDPETFWLFGGFISSGPGSYRLNDLWKYLPSSNEWTWVRGSNFIDPIGIYGTVGIANSTTGPGGRNGGIGSYSTSSSHSDIWAFGGFGFDGQALEGRLNDLWQFRPSENSWTWVSGSDSVITARNPNFGSQGTESSTNVPGGRYGFSFWRDLTGDLWIFGGASFMRSDAGYSNDLWRFRTTTQQWTWMHGSDEKDGYIEFGIKGVPSNTATPPSREGAATWVDAAGDLWMFGGIGGNMSMNGEWNDLWRYRPSTNQWTWIGGSDRPAREGIYGTRRVPSTQNVPGGRRFSRSWIDSKGDFWLFGGNGYDSVDGPYFLNDLWRYRPATSEWTWISGNNTVRDPPSVIEFRGVPSDSAVPSGREVAASWIDNQDNLWIFGGKNLETLADFWRFDTMTLQWTYLGVPLQKFGVFCDGFSEPNPKSDGGCVPICGNGVLNDGEECDAVGLGCSSSCTCRIGFIQTNSIDCLSLCNNSVLDSGEQCDGGIGCTNCRCTDRYVPTFPVSLNCTTCGNNVVDVDSGEECDGGQGCNNCICDAQNGFSAANPPNQNCYNPTDANNVPAWVIAVSVVVPSSVIIGVGIGVGFYFKKRRAGKQITTKLPNWLRRREKDANDTEELRELKSELENLPPHLFIPYDDLVFVKLLGSGAYGQVYEGTWQKSPVALKVSTNEQKKRFIQEVQLVSSIRPHPYVVQLFGYSIHPDNLTVVLVMEFCNQGSLDTTLYDTNAIVKYSQKLEWIKNIARGILHLHTHNIIHRDIAARNILLSNNVPRVADFGLSRQIAEERQQATTNAGLGPIRWMAPESIRSQVYSTKTDVWMFGCLCYEIITQTEPHVNAVDQLDIAIQIRDHALTPGVPTWCPKQLQDIIKSCWHEDPDQRPDMDSVIESLEKYL